VTLRDPCDHGRYEPHDFGYDLLETCPGGRTLSDAEALRTLLFDVGLCGLAEKRLDLVIAVGEALAASGIEDVAVLIRVSRAALAALDPEEETENAAMHF
jgi:hypothetical protein